MSAGRRDELCALRRCRRVDVGYPPVPRGRPLERDPRGCRDPHLRGCGERELVTPHLERLHQAIARALSRQTALLTAEAVSFLRKWLGLTAGRFAVLMGVRIETIYRWERLGSTQTMTPADDHLLKLLVAHNLADHYPLELLTVTERRRTPAAIVLVAPGWSAARSEPDGADPSRSTARPRTGNQRVRG
jgi:DNA-binding transcriptional regulator YiaG